MNLNLNLTPSPFAIQHQIGNGNIDPLSDPNNPSSSPVSCHIFFDSTQDHNMLYYHDDHPEFYEPQHTSDENHGNFDHGGSTYEIENNRIDQSGLKITLWKKENHQEKRVNDNPLKWMSSKMRLMYKIKNNHDRLALKITKNKIENQTSYFETGNKSNCNDSSYTSHISPVRICSDCNTTKTPLWRSGPKGPKSLCNACGIRQRKARRAMAMAAAANGTAVVASNHQTPATTKIKVRHKGNNTHFKKRCKIVTREVGSQSNCQKKIGFEDFVINLSKNLSFHRVFPEDERDAAILLMALSSGLVSS